MFKWIKKKIIDMQNKADIRRAKLFEKILIQERENNNIRKRIRKKRSENDKLLKQLIDLKTNNEQA